MIREEIIEKLKAQIGDEDTILLAAFNAATGVQTGEDELDDYLECVAWLIVEYEKLTGKVPTARRLKLI